MGMEMDVEYVAAMAPLVEQIGKFPKPKVHDIDGRRSINIQVGVSRSPIVPQGVEYSIHHIPTSDGYKLPIYHIRKSKIDQSAPDAAIIHTHGGGYFCMSSVASVPSLAEIVLQRGIQVFSVDYRLSPEYPYPTPLDDCWTGLRWVLSQASEFNIDTSRIGVMGESAGGGLAAAITLRAREVGLSPPIARQILVYPMLDDRNKDTLTVDGPVIWDDVDNLTGWTAYLGYHPGGDNVPIFAAPGRIEDASGLPPLYLDVGQLDLFLKENLDYVRKFVEANIETEFHIYPSLPHGFEGLAPDLEISKRVQENRMRFLKKL